MTANRVCGVGDLPGKGEAGLRGGPAGDLYIFLSIKPHEFFQRDGADIFCRVPVSMTTAALGGEFQVPTIDGGKTKVKIPEGTQTGKQFRLKGKGMPVLRSTRVGEMYIQVAVETPVASDRKRRQSSTVRAVGQSSCAVRCSTSSLRSHSRMPAESANSAPPVLIQLFPFKIPNSQRGHEFEFLKFCSEIH